MLKEKKEDEEEIEGKHLPIQRIEKERVNEKKKEGKQIKLLASYRNFIVLLLFLLFQYY